MAIRESQIKTLKPADKRYTVADVDGLFLEIMPTGKKYWRVRHKKFGKRATTTIGEYPTIALTEARLAALQIKTTPEEPESPKKHIPSFKDLAMDYITRQEAISRSKSERSKKKERIRLNAHVLPFIGNKPINEVTKADIADIIKRLEARGTIETAYRVLSYMRHIFERAIASDYCASDPTFAFKKLVKKPQQTHYASLQKPEEISHLLKCIWGYPFAVVHYAMQLTALTFVRPGELRHAEWSEINFSDSIWRIPGEKMKMKLPHLVPLSVQALEVLQQIQPITGHGRYIFPNAKCPAGDRPMSENAVRVALRSMGFTNDQMTAHGFRSMASTILNEKGWQPDAIERQLAHVEGNSVRAAYNYAQYMDVRKEMIQWWADYLDGLRDGQKKEDS